MKETQPGRQQREVMVVGVDESELSFYSLQWTLDHFFAPFAPHFPFKLVVVHAKPSHASAIGLAGPGAIEVLPIVDAVLRKIAGWVMQKAKDICNSRSVNRFRPLSANDRLKSCVCSMFFVIILIMSALVLGLIAHAKLYIDRISRLADLLTQIKMRLWP